MIHVYKLPAILKAVAQINRDFRIKLILVRNATQSARFKDGVHWLNYLADEDVPLATFKAARRKILSSGFRLLRKFPNTLPGAEPNDIVEVYERDGVRFVISPYQFVVKFAWDK